MSLRRRSRPSAGRRGCRTPGVAVAAALFLALTIAPGWAQQAAVDRFSATVPVDATAATVVKAREMARLAGQRRALDAVVQGLGGPGAPAKLPKLSDQAITDLVASFAVANERMSTVRYQADYTFHFRPDAIRDLLSEADIALVAPPPPAATAAPGALSAGPLHGGTPVVVVPLWQAGTQTTTLWEDPNPWRDAWNQQAVTTGAVPLVIPLGDAGDVAAIDAAQAQSGDVQALAAEAQRNGAGAALVALAAPQGPADKPGGVDVTVRTYRAGQLAAHHVVKLTANPGESEDALLRRAVAAIAADVENDWATTETAANGPPASLTAVLPIASLDDWLHARDRLATVPQIRKLELIALSRQQATIEIDYVGSLDQLQAGLAQISFGLVGDAPQWRLARNGSGATP
jgi:hypothetical protein